MTRAGITIAAQRIKVNRPGFRSVLVLLQFGSGLIGQRRHKTGRSRRQAIIKDSLFRVG